MLAALEAAQIGIGEAEPEARDKVSRLILTLSTVTLANQRAFSKR
jgi:hypothetical protein